MGRLFEEVKACLTMRQVAEHYGYKPNKANMIHSPFNPNDENPSCKLYEKTFCDFFNIIQLDKVATLFGLFLCCCKWIIGKQRRNS